MPQVFASSISDPFQISGLYLLTRETDNTGALLAAVAQALSGGARVLQYRDKSADAGRRIEQALALVALCHRHGVPLIVNDDVELARSVGAAGVHLGEHDAAISTARAELGAHCIIGVSCYNDLSYAAPALAAGADYIAVGAFFDSGTKPMARRASLQLLRDARQFQVPVVAIGGINAANGAALVDAGADALAVLGAVWDAPDIGVAARAISSLFSYA